MQQTVEGIFMIMLHYLIAHMQVLKEATAVTVLNEWERTCLPPQNEKVNNTLFMHEIYGQYFLDESCFPFSLGYVTVRDD